MISKQQRAKWPSWADPLALIGSADRFILEFQVDEKDITKIKLKAAR